MYTKGIDGDIVGVVEGFIENEKNEEMTTGPEQKPSENITGEKR